ncbi:hypothetical protein, partial [Enterobacter hormaechei]|uniref:hypothetical protein n=1 Tax=Enterobacter hormaechei TaxID=158836 RepID=UPI002A764242
MNNPDNTRRLALMAVAAVVMLSSFSPLAAEDNTQFDSDILKNRGLDAGLGKYFSESARYTPGVHTVSVQVNGK